MSIKLTLCGKKCTEDCMVYETPLASCYNPLKLFPGDPQWGPYDVVDTLRGNTLTRTFYESTDGTCRQPAESADVPLGVKVGPMGDPRGCGWFSV